MSISSILKKTEKSHNIKVAGYGGIIRMNFVPSLKKLSTTREHLSSIDSISNYDQFEKDAGFLVHSKESLHQVYYGTESYRYGYYSELVNYSGMKKWFIPVFTAMEHGVRFGGADWIYDENNIAYACESPSRIDEIRKKNANMPIFVLGTYINYVRPYYNELQFRAMKEKLGKTLLIFLSHSTDSNDIRIRGNNIIDNIYDNYAADFDTIMVCVYWNDMKDEQVQKFKEKGAMLVSSGYRADENFVRRLRTLIELSDYVVGNDIGTNTGFCQALGKQFALVSSENRAPFDEYYCKVYSEFEEAFIASQGKYGFTEEQLKKQNELYERFWGGEKYNRTPEEVNAMLSVMKKICKMAKYKIKNFPCAIEKYLSKEQTSERGKLEKKLLLESLGREQ